MTPSTSIELVPAPAMTAGIVNTPVPMMLPITSAVADGRPRPLDRVGGTAAGAGAATGASGGAGVWAGGSMMSVTGVLPFELTTQCQRTAL